MGSDLRTHLLAGIYGADTGRVTAGRLDDLIRRHGVSGRSVSEWNERDAWLIAYPDQFSEAGSTPLATLQRLLDDWSWLTGVHVLPCYPWTSDDGFAVTDYHSIDPDYGTWEDVSALSQGGRHVMLDAVINHMSSESHWFQAYLEGDPDFQEFFVEQVPGADYRNVVRPRTSPLFHPFSAHDGVRRVWTTFSADQVDLDYANPRVLEAVADVLLTYCVRGATALRLDAIGFMWKEPGTSSLHLRQTHELIAVLGSAVREAFPGTIVVSEVNVPHAENIAYLGSQDQPESDMIYQFTLAPLTLYAVQTGDCSALVRWASGLAMPRTGVSFLNFLASHDGVGVRPAEGLVASLDPLLEAVSRANGAVSYRELPDGSSAPYELNCTWFDLVGGMGPHLATHAVMMAMPGVPLIYAHSLFGSPNDQDLYRRTGRARSLNRHKFYDAPALERDVASTETRAGRVFAALRDMAGWRATHPAFHPEADHRVSEPAKGVLRIDRFRGDRAAAVVVNLSGEDRHLDLRGADSLDGRPPTIGKLEPWEHRWLDLG